MSISIAPFSQPIQQNTRPCCLDQTTKIFDSIAQFAIKIFRQISDFFYNFLYKKPNNPPETLFAEVIPQQDAPATIKTVRLENDVDLQTMISFYHGEEMSPYGLVLLDFSSEGDRRMKFEDFDHNDDWLWAFPTIELSSDIPTGPLLNTEDFNTFLKDPIVRENIVKVFKHVLAYFGLQLNDKHLVEKGPNFEERAKYWITYNNHNYKRIGRILSSLLDMQMYGDLSPNREGYAGSLVDCLKTIFDENKELIGYRNYQRWWRQVFH